MNLLFFDTETSGLPLYSEPSDDPRQPHLLELSASVVDSESREVVAVMDTLVQPDGWEIEEGAKRIHGITAEEAAEKGRPEPEVLAEFLAMWRGCDVRLAYNEPFDARVVRIACKRYAPEVAPHWTQGRTECIGQLARKATGGERMPRLATVYAMVMGRPLEGAHRARTDMEACRDVYWAVRRTEPRLAIPASEMPTGYPVYPDGYQGSRSRRRVPIHKTTL